MVDRIGTGGGFHLTGIAHPLLAVRPAPGEGSIRADGRIGLAVFFLGQPDWKVYEYRSD